MSGLRGLTGGDRSAAAQYRQIDLASRTDGASPHVLVTLLYEELSIALGVMTRAGEAGDAARRGQLHERACTILHALEHGLDLRGGGDLARSLAQIYGQMRRRLTAARAGDDAALAEISEGVASLSAAWARIAA